MARPKVALVDREDVIAKALGIIDREGLDALSLRRIGTELGVSGAALYHHFADKDEILRGVVERVLSREVIAHLGGSTWEDFVVESAVRYRAALVAHPNTAPLMVHLGSGARFGNTHREFVVRRMLEAGVPRRLCYPIMDSTETLAFGSAMMNPRQLPIHERLGLDGGGQQPNLEKVVRASAKAADRVFRLELSALVEGWRALIAEA